MATYTYTYDFAGGSYNGKTSYSQVFDTNNLATSTLVAATRSGYKLRWYTITASSTGSQLGNNAAAGQQIQVPSNLTLTAVWDQIYYIRYNLAGGYFDSNYSYVNEKWNGYQFALREAPIRTGYTFNGWRDRDYNGALWAPGQQWGADVNTLLTAEWTRNSTNTATINYNLNGGTGKTSDTVAVGSSITLPTPTRSGYIFLNWTSNHDNDYDGSNDTFNGGGTYSYSNNVTLTANWEKETTVTKEIGYILQTRGSMTTTGSSYVNSYYTERFYGPSLPISANITTKDPYLFGWDFKDWTKTYPSPTGVTYKGGEAISMNDDWKLSANFVWTNKTYLVKFYDNGGTGSPTSLSYTDTGEGHTVDDDPASWKHTFTIPPTKPTRVGYTFKGWAKTENSDTVSYKPNDTITVSVNYGAYADLYAVWEKNEVYYNYTVTYDAQGGSPTPAKLSSGNTTATQYNTNVTTVIPKKTDFVFVGWSKNANSTTAAYEPGSMLSIYSTNPEVVLYAIYRAAHSTTFSIVYNTNGGSSIPSTTSTGTEASKTLIITYSEPTKSGYKFKGWARNSTDTTVSYVGGDSITLYSSLPSTTLYAIWEVSEVKTTFYLYYNANNGTGAPPTQTATSTGSSYTFTISRTKPTRSGYTFLGWATSASATTALYDAGDSITIYTTSRTLYAVWSANVVQTYTYKLAYNANGGSGAPSTQNFTSTTYNATHTFAISTNQPTRSGYLFKGWSDYSSSTTVQYTAGSTIRVNVNSIKTIYAVWEKAVTEKYVFQLSFNANGGTGAPNTLSYVSTTNVSHTFTIPNAVPTRIDHTFIGWAEQSSSTTAQIQPGDRYNQTTLSKTLYAVWEYTPPVTYTFTLKYNMSGGTGTIADQTHTGTSNRHNFLISSTVPTKTNFVFIGWSTTANGTVAEYSSGSYIYVTSGTTTLYAVWSEQAKYDYSLIYDTNGSSDSIVRESITDSLNAEETFKVTTIVPTREGYTFLGWDKNPSSEKASLSAGDMIVCKPGHTTLYAIWQINSYKLTYNANDGTNAPAEETREFASNLRLTYDKPTREGYEFSGWSPISTGSALYSAGSYFYMPSHDMTLYAVWTVGSYTVTYDANGGTLNDVTSYNYEYNQVVTVILSIPTRSGYKFGGWVENVSNPTDTYFANDSFNMPSRNVTLVAKWDYAFTLIFNPNGGSSGPNTMSYASSTTSYVFTIPNGLPVRDFYTCVGWSTDPNATSPSYVPGATITNKWDNVNYGTIVLYAVWEMSFALYTKIEGSWKQLVLYNNVED